MKLVETIVNIPNVINHQKVRLYVANTDTKTVQKAALDYFHMPSNTTVSCSYTNTLPLRS